MELFSAGSINDFFDSKIQELKTTVKNFGELKNKPRLIEYILKGFTFNIIPFGTDNMQVSEPKPSRSQMKSLERIRNGSSEYSVRYFWPNQWSQQNFVLLRHYAVPREIFDFPEFHYAPIKGASETDVVSFELPTGTTDKNLSDEKIAEIKARKNMIIQRLHREIEKLNAEILKFNRNLVAEATKAFDENVAEVENINRIKGGLL